MIPTLKGRYHTRVFLVAVVASIWTLLVTPFLPANDTGLGLWDKATQLYPATFAVLAIVLVVGMVLWEWVYYLLQLCRWEKDWPSMFFLLQMIPEGVVAYVIFRNIGIDTDGVATTYATFVTHFVTTWILIWLFALGPIKILFIRWRFNGGKIFW